MIHTRVPLVMLAIDDEVSMQLILKNYFKSDFLVITKNNGKDALEWMLEGNFPDMIIADINMPHMDGYTFIEQVKASGYLSNIPMVILSGNDFTNNKIRCLESGADDFIVKPFNPRELAARIKAILRRTTKNKYHVTES